MRSLIIFFVICVSILMAFAHIFKTGKLQNYLDKHPNPTWVVRTQYYIAKYYSLRRNPQKSIESTERILKFYPKTPFAEHALYLQAYNLKELGKIKEARQTYLLFIETYPDSKKRTLAKKKHDMLWE